MIARLGGRFVSAPALLLVIALLVILMPGGPRVSRAAQEAPVQGDVTCDSSVNAVDSLQILRDVAGLGTAAGCLADAGDVNCDAAVNSVDSLRILRYVAGLSVTAPDGCSAIGEPLGPPPTSEALIAAALEADDITYEESLLARAYALFDDPRLQDEFRSPVIDLEAAIPLFTEIEEKRTQLPQDLLDDLAPIMARPNDPISIFNNPPAQASGESAAAGATWRSRAVEFTNARVWVKDTSDAPLTGYEIAVAKVWPKLQQVFGLPRPDKVSIPTADINPDTRIDIYFAAVADVDPRDPACADCSLEGANGLTPATDLEADHTSSAHVLIRDTLSGDYLLKVIAHELAHTVQFKYDFEEDFWLMDSTADWVGFRVLQELKTATKANLYDRAKIIFDNSDKPLSRDVGESRYAAWLFFYFASMEKGDGIVTQIWEAAAAAGVQGEQAVDQKLPFDDYFDDFTVRNWNQKPPLKTAYKDKDSTFPPYVPEELAEVIQGPSETPIEVDLAALSADYLSFTFDKSVRTIVFDNKLSGVEHIHVWGIVKVGDTWKEPEDWSDVPKKEWCRDDPEEDITELVIIVSNSDMTTRIFPPEDAVVEAKAAGCSGWRGTATSTTWWDNFGYGTGIATATFEGSWEPIDDRGPSELIECEWVLDDEIPCLPFYPTGNISWSWNSDIPGDPPCHESVTGQLAAAVLPWPFNQNQIFVLQPDGQGQYRYWGDGYFEIPGWNQGPHCDNTINGGDRPDSFFSGEWDLYYGDEPSAITPDDDGGTCGMQAWSISSDATTIKGSCYDFNHSYNHLLYEWEFHRYGEPH